MYLYHIYIYMCVCVTFYHVLVMFLRVSAMALHRSFHCQAFVKNDEALADNELIQESLVGSI